MSNTRLFDVYFALDFSARSKPTRRKESPDALWLAELVVEAEGAALVTSEKYCRTRYEVYAHLLSRLLYHLDHHHRIFLGVDFALGYPQGFARALGLDDTIPAWKATWELLTALIQEYPNNRNNRFAVASALNARINAPTPGPFWGCPPSQQSPYLLPTSALYPFRVSQTLTLERLRHTERATTAAQPTWKLNGNGSVGGQTLLGIPFLQRLITELAKVTHTDIFPFTWHFRPQVPSAPAQLLVAEIYPSIIRLPLDPILIKDQSQVRNTVLHFATLDREGTLAPSFAPPATLPSEASQQCINEEGWIVGL
jgi:hypothetical protein